MAWMPEPRLVSFRPPPWRSRNWGRPGLSLRLRRNRPCRPGFSVVRFAAQHNFKHVTYARHTAPPEWFRPDPSPPRGRPSVGQARTVSRLAIFSSQAGILFRQACAARGTHRYFAQSLPLCAIWLFCPPPGQASSPCEAWRQPSPWNICRQEPTLDVMVSVKRGPPCIHPC